MISKLADQSDTVFAVGDFNLSSISWIDTSNVPSLIPIKNNDLLNKIFDLSFYKTNSVCNDFGKILDLVFVNDKCTLIRCEPVTSPEDCYHPTLKIIIDVSTVHTSTNKHITNQNKYYCFPRLSCLITTGILYSLLIMLVI